MNTVIDKSHEVSLRYLAWYAVIVFALLFFFFSKSGIGKMVVVFLVFIFAFQIPGTELFILFTKRYGRTAVLLGPVFGIISMTLWAYLLGEFSIHFKYSLFVSLGIPYLFIITSKGLISFVKKIKIE